MPNNYKSFLLVNDEDNNTTGEHQFVQHVPSLSRCTFNRPDHEMKLHRNIRIDV